MCPLFRRLFFSACHVLRVQILSDVSSFEQVVRFCAVGGMGMVCTANYEARKFGVRAAMPGFIGRKLCPHLVFVQPDFSKYTAAAEEARAVFACVDPKFVSAGLDEASLDTTAYCAATGLSPDQVRSKMSMFTGQRMSTGNYVLHYPVNTSKCPGACFCRKEHGRDMHTTEINKAGGLHYHRKIPTSDSRK
jgi:hypothetical protein